MCTHGRWITNKYTGENLYVKCGKCVACQMERATRYFSRIMNHEADRDYFRVFITLNYDNASLPFVDFSEVDFASDVFNVYRSQTIRRYRKGKIKKKLVEHGRFLLGTVNVNSFDMRYYQGSLDGLCEPQKFGNSSCVGVIYSPDFNNFLKRFKQNAKRYYGLDFFKPENKLHYYKIAEYGPTTRRPHFHAILYFPNWCTKHYTAIKRSLIASWPFCSYKQINENIGIAVSGQDYVSSYTVRPSDYPDFLKIRKISQKPSYSRGFGFGRSAFNPANIYNLAQEGDFSYIYETVDKNGNPCRVASRVPQYVYNRFFPKFKGFHRLTSRQVYSVLVDARMIYYYGRLLDYTPADYIIFNRRYYRALDYYPFGRLNVYDYAFRYVNFFSRKASYDEKILHIGFNGDYREFYDNIADVAFHKVQCPTVHVDSTCNLDPNKFSSRVEDYERKASKYSDKLKVAKINDYAASLRVNYITHCLT